MFASLMTEHCGLLSWRTNSEIVHAVAESPLAPFVIPHGQPAVVPRFAHNPTVHRNKQGRFLLYHIGCGSTPGGPCASCLHCKNGSTPVFSTEHQQGRNESCNGPHWTGLLTSASVDGPWRDEGEVLLDTNKRNKWITNPCVSPAGLGSDFAEHNDSNTTFLLYRQSGNSWPGDHASARERLGWALDDNCPTAINCTYRDMSPDLPILNISLEDQFLWRDHR